MYIIITATNFIVKVLPHSFSRARFPATEILPLCVYLAYYERKALELLQKALLWIKTS